MVSDHGISHYKKRVVSVHNVEGKYYFEIPEICVAREMLMVTTMPKLPQVVGTGEKGQIHKCCAGIMNEKKHLTKGGAYSRYCG